MGCCSTGRIWARGLFLVRWLKKLSEEEIETIKKQVGMDKYMESVARKTPLVITEPNRYGLNGAKLAYGSFWPKWCFVENMEKEYGKYYNNIFNIWNNCCDDMLHFTVLAKPRKTKPKTEVIKGNIAGWIYPASDVFLIALNYPSSESAESITKMLKNNKHKEFHDKTILYDVATEQTNDFQAFFANSEYWEEIYSFRNSSSGNDNTIYRFIK